MEKLIVPPFIKEHDIVRSERIAAGPFCKMVRNQVDSEWTDN